MKVKEVAEMKHLLIEYMKQFTEHSDAELSDMIKEILINQFKKGDLLLSQGDTPEQCYFILKGCIRQYAVDEHGNEHTSNFYTENQSVTIFNQHRHDKASPYALECLEDTVVIGGDLATEQTAYDEHPELESMTRKMIEQDFGTMRADFSSFLSSTPEERYQALVRNRPELLTRVPQYQLASYLGVKPESLSRIKKRLEKEATTLDD